MLRKTKPFFGWLAGCGRGFCGFVYSQETINSDPAAETRLADVLML